MLESLLVAMANIIQTAFFSCGGFMQCVTKCWPNCLSDSTGQQYRVTVQATAQQYPVISHDWLFTGLPSSQLPAHSPCWFASTVSKRDEPDLSQMPGRLWQCHSPVLHYMLLHVVISTRDLDRRIRISLKFIYSWGTEERPQGGV